MVYGSTDVPPVESMRASLSYRKDAIAKLKATSQSEVAKDWADTASRKLAGSRCLQIHLLAERLNVFR